MPNQKKKKKPEQVMEAWTNLKAKLTTWTQGKVVIYRDYTAPQKHPEQDYVHQLSMKDFLNLRQVGKSKEYEEQLRIRLNEYVRLEKKLERIKDLIADNEIEKLKRMCKKGEI